MPGFILVNRTAVALVHNYQVEKIGAELQIRVSLIVVICKPLIKRKIDFISLVNLLMPYDCKLVLKMLEVAFFRLDNQIISVGKIKNPFFAAGFSKSVNNLKRRISFACSCRHYKKNSVLTACDCLHSPVYCNPLIVTRLSSF